jgi:2-(1,2-epoxy-1,2-dihydrophenyl)acetyl-CoA isomerase
MPVSDQPVLLKVDGPIARIVFNRPKVLNALSVDAANAFLAACKSIAADKGNRVIVIAGEGRAFMAGGDISAFQGPADQVRRMCRPLWSRCTRVSKFWQACRSP